MILNDAVTEAMVGLNTPPPLSPLNVSLCVLVAIVLVLALIAAENGGIAAFVRSIRRDLS